MSLYSSKGSTNHVAECYGDLTEVTKAHIRAVGFKPIIHLLPERLASTILEQYLVERWWDTIHTFYIVEREMTVTPHDFHHMTSLRCDDAVINLKGESGTQLAIDLLGRRYSTDTIRYYNIEVDYRPLP